MNKLVRKPVVLQLDATTSLEGMEQLSRDLLPLFGSSLQQGQVQSFRHFECESRADFVSVDVSE